MMAGTYPYNYNGKYAVKTKAPGQWFTELQLNKMGYTIRNGEQPTKMYTNQFCERTALYYTMEQMEKNEKAETIIHEKRKIYMENTKKRKAVIKDINEAAKNWHTSKQWLDIGRIPNDNAKWRQGGHNLLPSVAAHLFPTGSIGNSNYYYCHIRDTHEATGDELQKIKDKQNKMYEEKPNEYNGKIMKAQQKYEILIDGNLYEGSDNKQTATYLYRTVDETCLHQYNGHTKELIEDGISIQKDTIKIKSL